MMSLMPSHVALLRGINVGGAGKVPMAQLRELVTKLGHEDVATYIQSGNIVFTPSHDNEAALAAELTEAISDAFGVRTSAIVVSRSELAAVIAANPYPDEPEKRYVHGVFLPAKPDAVARKRVADAVAASAAKGSRDEAQYVGRVLYLHTPDGFGTSELAKDLTMKQKSQAPATGTARNWNTITKLLALCDA
jgi:uncharacterized protein (DUF1697 family)